MQQSQENSVKKHIPIAFNKIVMYFELMFAYSISFEMLSNTPEEKLTIAISMIMQPEIATIIEISELYFFIEREIMAVITDNAQIAVISITNQTPT